MKRIMKQNRDTKVMSWAKWVLPFYLFTFLPSNAQTQLTPYQPGITAEGMVYYLPKTAVRVSVLVEKTVYTPGEFCRYAHRYLRVGNVSEEPSVAYRVISINQQAVPVADNQKVYSVKYNTKSIAANVTLTDDGRLLGINTPDADDVVTAAPFLPAQKEELPNPKQFLTEEILVCGSTAKMAELTAREIYDLRENRNLLIKGQADFMPQDGKQMELMLAQLDRQDRSLTSLHRARRLCYTRRCLFAQGALPAVADSRLYRC